jgi:hypothetical protein
MRHFDVFNAGPCQFVAVILCLALTPLAISQTTSSAGVSDRAAADEGLPVGAGLNFSESPADSEFPRVGLFAQPLIRVGTTNPEENKELAALLTVYADALHRGNRDEVLPLSSFCTSSKVCLEGCIAAESRRGLPADRTLLKGARDLAGCVG